MKNIIFILTLFFTLNIYAELKCYISNESEVQWRTDPLQGALNEPCPVNDRDLRISDITYLKIKPLACVGEQDCFEKSENHCTDIIDNIPVIIGRLIVSQDFTEIYCTKPIFSQSKRNQRLAEENSRRQEAQNKRLAKQTARQNIISLEPSIDSMTLEQLKNLVKEMVTIIKD